MKLTIYSLALIFSTVLPGRLNAAPTLTADTLSDEFYNSLARKESHGEYLVQVSPRVRKALVEAAVDALNLSVNTTLKKLQNPSAYENFNEDMSRSLGTVIGVAAAPRGEAKSIRLAVLDFRHDFGIPLVLASASESERISYISEIVGALHALNIRNNQIGALNAKSLIKHDTEMVSENLDAEEDMTPARRQHTLQAAAKMTEDSILRAVNVGESRVYEFLASVTMELTSMAYQNGNVAEAAGEFLKALSADKTFRNGLAYQAFSTRFLKYKPGPEAPAQIRKLFSIIEKAPASLAVNEICWKRMVLGLVAP